MVEVPGPDGERGFGGKCLPKDTMGFNSIFKSDQANREQVFFNGAKSTIIC